MTLEQLEKKVNELEIEVAELRRELKPLRPVYKTDDTFGMFSDDAEFEELVEFGREYRDQANTEDR